MTTGLFYFIFLVEGSIVAVVKVAVLKDFVAASQSKHQMEGTPKASPAASCVNPMVWVLTDFKDTSAGRAKMVSLLEKMKTSYEQLHRVISNEDGTVNVGSSKKKLLWKIDACGLTLFLLVTLVYIRCCRNDVISINFQ